MTTPLERAILTHYYVSPTPYPNESSLSVELVSRFVDLGLLRRLDFHNEFGAKIEGNKDALEPYMDALAAVPLPVQRWVIP